MTNGPVLHLPDESYQPIVIQSRKGARKSHHWHSLCGLHALSGNDVASPGDESLADCKRCLKIAAARKREAP